jgi:hypothetical protein
LLRGPHLGVNLSSSDLRLLLLLVVLLLVEEELHTWLWCSGPHHDRRDGRGYHVAPSRAGGYGAPPAPEAAPSTLEQSSRAVCKDGDPLCTIPTKVAPKSPSLTKSQAAKAVGGQLQATKTNGFAWSEANAGQVVAVGNEREFR